MVVNLYTQKSFQFAKIELIMLAMTIIGILLSYALNMKEVMSVSVLPFFTAVFISFIGSYYSIRSISEPNNLKKIVSLFVNFSFTSLFFILIIANVIDIIRVFK